MNAIDPQELKRLLTGGGEIAFIDVREAGQFGEGHPFFAINIPYSRLELRVEQLVPRKGAAIVLLDGGDGVAEKAAARLAALGYSDVKLLAGGAAAWGDAGFTLYKGVNLPSKTFGELVEHACETPHVTASQLHAMQTGGQDLILLDGRTPHEYARMTIPGSRSCPNAELGHRLPSMLSDTSTPVIVNCAGRTRSIIGAQSLINLGLENPVFALENGTQGWVLAGFELDRGNAPQSLDRLGGEGLAQSRRAAGTLIQKHGLSVIERTTLETWRGVHARTLYLLDVRTTEEFAAGHLPGSLHAPGGQLVQATDQWVGVRGARIVLVDDTGLRAAQTAHWLRQMGHEAHVLEGDVTVAGDLVQGEDRGRRMEPVLAECAPSALAERLEKGAVLLDLGPSMRFREDHLAQARWAIRPRVDRLGLDAGSDIILTAEKRGFAELAVPDLLALGCKRLSFLPRDPGRETVATPNDPPDDECIDFLFFVHDRHADAKEAMRGYLEWEIALIDQLDAQERAVFTPGP